MPNSLPCCRAIIHTNIVAVGCKLAGELWFGLLDQIPEVIPLDTR